MWNKRRPLFLSLCVCLRIYSRYGIFSSAGQHGSFIPGVSLHHEALRNAFTGPDWFGQIDTLILDQSHGALTIVVACFSTTETSVMGRWRPKCFLGVMYGVIFMVGLSHHCFNLVFFRCICINQICSLGKLGKSQLRRRIRLEENQSTNNTR